MKSHHSPLSSTVQTTSNPHLGTVSGRVTLVMDSAVQLLKMIGCVVLDVLLETGVPTTSSLDLGVANGVVADAVRNLGALPPNEIVSPRRRLTALAEEGRVAWTRKDANMSHVNVATVSAAHPRRMKTHLTMTLSPLLKITLQLSRLVGEGWVVRRTGRQDGGDRNCRWD